MHIIWAIVGIFFILLDFKKPSKIKLSMSQGSLFCAIYAYKFPHDIYFQPLVFILLVFVSYFFITHIYKNEQKDNLKKDGLKDCTGKTAIVTKDIGKTLSVDGIGRINYNNEIYKAKSVDDKTIKAGEEVIIVSRENLIVNVKAV